MVRMIAQEFRSALMQTGDSEADRPMWGPLLCQDCWSVTDSFLAVSRKARAVANFASSGLRRAQSVRFMLEWCTRP